MCNLVLVWCLPRMTRMMRTVRACVRCVFGFAFKKRAVETNGHAWIAVETADGTSDENTWKDLGLHSGA